MKQKVLIISDQRESGSELARWLGIELPYEIAVNLEPSAIADELSKRVVHLVIVDQKVVSEDTLALVNWLKHSEYTFPIIVVAKTITAHFAQQLHLSSDIHLLVRPIYAKTIVGLVRKLIFSKAVRKQTFRRFNTNQIAEVEALQTGESWMTSMYNLSQSGAYCEFEAGASCSVGDLIRLKVRIEETNREYSFNAKVVWTTDEGKFSGRPGVGLRFVSQKDTYRSLLSKS
jgi:DNA-binding NtrC family response regulator